MMLPSGDPKAEQVLESLAELARGSVGPPSLARLDRGLQRLSATFPGRVVRRKGFLTWSLMGGAPAVVSVALTFCVLWFSSTTDRSRVTPPISYRIEGGNMVEGGYLRAAGEGSMKLSFAEGTEFVLEPRTRARLGLVNSAGARVAIEEGSASFQVTPRPGARWMVDVGPFLVSVKGTAFTVLWDPVSERFELNLRQGRVTISGPVSGGDVALKAGQRLVVNLTKGETLIAEMKPEDSALEFSRGRDPAVAPTLASPQRPRGKERSSSERSAESDSRTRPHPSKAVDHRWAADLAIGQLDKILVEAEQAGLKSTLEEASVEELFALATAARYRKRVELAHEALLAERRRFAGSRRALDATFFLGRLEESDERGAARAVEWYDRYLIQAPGGRYASEALGRKMIAISKTEGAARAAGLAEEYLRRFPSGSYAGAARALRQLP